MNVIRAKLEDFEEINNNFAVNRLHFDRIKTIYVSFLSFITGRTL